MSLRPSVVAMIALLLLVPAACGSGSEPEAAPSAPPDPTLTATAPTGKPSVQVPPSSGTTVTGVVGEADENSCLTLTSTGADRTTWLLVGAPTDLQAGARVTLRGSPAPDLATRCQQGTPFVVEAVEPG